MRAGNPAGLNHHGYCGNQTGATPMKRIIIAAMFLAVLGGLMSVAPAEAASSARRTPGCVTKAEYKKIKRGHSMATVKNVFGNNGRYSSVVDSSYWIWGDYVSDGYYTGDWVYDWETDSYYWDEYAGDWIDNSYWEDDTYVYAVDSNRDYKKCSSWNHGRGRVAINFDNYTSRYSGYRVYAKWVNRPWFWNVYGLRTSDVSVLGDKPDTGHASASGHRDAADAAKIEARAVARAKADKPTAPPAN